VPYCREGRPGERLGERERETAGATGRSASGWNEDRREILGMREDPDRKLQKRMQRPKEAAQWCFFLHFAYARRDGVTVRDGLIHVFCMSTS
jgi:pyruvate-formate lyase